MTLTEILKQSAQKHPHNTALIMRMGYRTLRLSYQEVFDLAVKVASLLQQNGFQKGDKALLYSFSSPYWVVVFWGVLLAGGVPVPLFAPLSSEIIQTVARETKAKFIFKSLQSRFNAPIDAKVYDFELIPELTAEAGNSSYAEIPLHENDLAVLFYDFGADGVPRGLPLTHKALFSRLHSIAELIPFHSKDKILSTLPLNAPLGLIAGLLSPFTRAATVVFSHSPTALYELLHEHRVNQLIAPPDFLARMADHFGPLAPKRSWFGPSLRITAVGSAPLEPELIQKWTVQGIRLKSVIPPAELILSAPPMPSSEPGLSLIALLADITGVDPSTIADATTMGQLNLDSLRRIELVARGGDLFGVHIEEPRITSSTTALELKQIIQTSKSFRNKPHFPDFSTRWWARLIRNTFLPHVFFNLYRRHVKLEVKGLENLKNLPLPALFAPNHTTFADSLLMYMALPPKIRRRLATGAAVDVLYKDFEKIAWISDIMFNSFRFPRREVDVIEYGLHYAGRRVDQGYSLMLFPEGKMSKEGKLLPLKRGAALIATSMGIPVVPAKITGALTVMPKDKFFPTHKGNVIVEFGKPLYFKRSDSVHSATEKIHEAMQRM